MTDDDALAERLVAIAMRLQAHDPADDLTEALGDLAEVSEVADTASGPSRALAEVAEAFLRVITRGAGGPDAAAVHGFLRVHLDSGFTILRQALTVDGVGIGDGLKADPAMQLLLTRAILEEVRPGHFRVNRPSARKLVRNALAPLHLRLWEQVQHARAETGGSERQGQAKALAGRLGCTLAEAEDHLRRFPLRQVWTDGRVAR